MESWLDEIGNEGFYEDNISLELEEEVIIEDVKELPFKISQSLVKEVIKSDHCPKQIYYSFVEGKELLEKTDSLWLGRYFESELLGSCRGGEKEEAKRHSPISLKPKSNASKPELIAYITKYDNTGYVCDKKTNEELREFIKFMPNNDIPGEKAEAFVKCDNTVLFAREVLQNLGLNISKGKSQIYEASEFLSSNVDHRNKDLIDDRIKANYDVKWTATEKDDRWNGWGNPEDKYDAKIQATHYTLVDFELTGNINPFYFLIFGQTSKGNWAKVIRFDVTKEAIEDYKHKIAYTAKKITEYSNENYKGNGDFNKCISCPFYSVCEDKKTIVDIEYYKI
ncbi:TPA: hypothetical protein ACG0AB_000785 [Elizabethkingia anophelis]